MELRTSAWLKSSVIPVLLKHLLKREKVWEAWGRFLRCFVTWCEGLKGLSMFSKTQDRKMRVNSWRYHSSFVSRYLQSAQEIEVSRAIEFHFKEVFCDSSALYLHNSSIVSFKRRRNGFWGTEKVKNDQTWEVSSSKSWLFLKKLDEKSRKK